MEMNERLLRLVLKEDTRRIIRLAVEKGLYPSQIASTLGVSKSSVVKKLNELERHGVIKSGFYKSGGSVVKKFQLAVEEFTIKVNLKRGDVGLKEKRVEAGPTERIKEIL
jgi:predicted transcriptional regulator